MEMVHPNERARVQAEVMNSVEHDAEYDTSFQVIWPNGEQHVIAARGKVYRDVQGNAKRMCGVCWDITNRRKMENALQKAASELVRSNKELEQFAYIASHDLQEPLRKIKSFGGMLADNYKEALGEEGRDFIQRMQTPQTECKCSFKICSLSPVWQARPNHSSQSISTRRW